MAEAQGRTQHVCDRQASRPVRHRSLVGCTHPNLHPPFSRTFYNTQIFNEAEQRDGDHRAQERHHHPRHYFRYVPVRRTSRHRLVCMRPFPRFASFHVFNCPLQSSVNA